MKCYTCNNFMPTGTAAVIIAKDKVKARDLLWDSLPLPLKKENDKDKLEIDEVDLHIAKCIILYDGDY